MPVATGRARGRGCVELANPSVSEAKAVLGERLVVHMRSEVTRLDERRIRVIGAIETAPCEFVGEPAVAPGANPRGPHKGGSLRRLHASGHSPMMSCVDRSSEAYVVSVGGRFEVPLRKRP